MNNVQTTRRLGHIALEVAQLPGLRWLAEPILRRRFEASALALNSCFGAYESFEQALIHAPSELPNNYNLKEAGRIFRDRHRRIRACDYPQMYWLGKLLGIGQRRIFDLGGHTGVTYYAYRAYLDYPEGLDWLVHDTPATVRAGRDWALAHDPDHQLTFTDDRNDADGRDILIAGGVLQYLDYTLPELLGRLRAPPRHVLVNETPMHPDRGYFTLQHIGIAICPYRVMSVPEFLAQMQALGYVVIEQWELPERSLQIPFEPDRNIQSYRGFYFRLDI